MDNIDTVDLGPAAQRLADLVARVTDDELGKPTPCGLYLHSEWSPQRPVWRPVMILASEQRTLGQQQCRQRG